MGFFIFHYDLEKQLRSMLQHVMHIRLSDPILGILKYPHITQFLNLVSTIHTILED
jgi:hypothetical protein